MHKKYDCYKNVFNNILFVFFGLVFYTSNVLFNFHLSGTLGDLNWLDGNFFLGASLTAGAALLLGKERPWYKHKFSIGTFLLSLFFSTVMIINNCLISEMDFLSPGKWGAWLFIVDILVFYFVLTISFDRAEKYIHAKESGSREEKHSWLLFFLLLVILWMPYVFLTYPGSMTYDTGAAINHFMGFVENINNPYFQTYLFGIVYWVGWKLGSANSAVAVYCVIQMLLYCYVISRFICSLGRWGCSQHCCICITVFMGVLPIFPLYALCMGKDSNFALCVLFFSWKLLQLTTDKNQFWAKKENIIALATAGILLGFLRNNGQWITVISLIPVAILECKREKRYAAITLCIILITGTVHALVPAILHIPDSHTSELFSIPLQQTGYYHTFFPDEITDEEYAAIYGVVTEKGLNSYNPRNVDPIKNTYKNDASKDTVRDYFKTLGKMFEKHPVAFIKAAYLHTYCYYTPGTISSDIKPHCSIGYVVFPSVFKNTTLTVQNETGTAIATKINDIFTQAPGIGQLQKIGIYTWILLSLCLFYVLKKQYANMIPLIPSVIVIIACCFSPINGYFRYAFPMILSVVLVGPGTLVSSRYQNSKTDTSDP